MSKPTNATPKPLSDEVLAILRSRKLCSDWFYDMDEEFQAEIRAEIDALALKAQPVLNKMPRCIHDGSKMEIMCRGCGDSFDGYSDKDKQLALTRGPQPPPVPLSEDEALIAQAGRLAEREDYPPFKQVLRESASRLSLRSGQLAQAKKWISAIFRESGPGSHPGRTPEEAADEILNGGTNG